MPHQVSQPAEEGPGEDEASASKAEWVDVEGGSADNDEGAPARGNRAPNKGKGRQGAPKHTVQSAQQLPPKAATGKRKNNAGGKEASRAGSGEALRKTPRRK
ncbi:hypothetical protein BDV93DRAFT_514454 [Ceratobasidium sp. AG-I]|nr:hypothetical protein BDV93DRAFT_514454 [Ceratobasidium sp. AG-I]